MRETVGTGTRKGALCFITAVFTMFKAKNHLLLAVMG